MAKFNGGYPPERYDPAYFRRMIEELKLAINVPDANNLTKNPIFDTIDLGGNDPNNIGVLSFNGGSRTLDINLSPSVTANIPTEQLLPRVVNKSGADIGDGVPVYIEGAQGSKPTIEVADASSYATSSKTMGLTTEPIANNAEGFVARAGFVRDIDTSAFAAGTCLYLSTTAGGFTATPPSTANGENKIILGMVMYQHANHGIICVKVMPDKDWFGNLDGGNYTYWESDGTMVSKGEATAWEDLQFQVSGGKVPASNAPTFDAFTTNTKEYAFDVNDYIYLSANEPPHAHEANSTAKFHLHVTPKTANSSGASQYAKFQVYLAYVYGNGTTVWAETSLTAELEIPDGTSAMTGFIFGLGDFDLTGFGVGGQVKPTLKRIAATGGTEYADKVFLTQLGMHFKVDMLGSREETSK